MASPYGFTRALVLGVGEVFTELHQARLQRRRNLQPRVSRSGAFLALRPASMLLRDVNVSLVAEQMARGAPVIYCDLVDYDEVAHHAGPARPESMRQLESLDRMLGVLQRLAPEAARHYHSWCSPTTARARAPRSASGTARRWTSWSSGSRRRIRRRPVGAGRAGGRRRARSSQSRRSQPVLVVCSGTWRWLYLDPQPGSG
jgi:hypothetical protein